MIRALAWMAALVTGALAVAADPGAGRLLAGLLYAVAATAALVQPIAMTVQTVLGMGLAASLILSGGAEPLVVASVVAGTVFSAELLGVYWTESLPLERERRLPAAPGVGPVVVSVGVYGLVVLAGSLPGPTGIGAVLLGAAATVAAAALLSLPSRGRRIPPGPTPSVRATGPPADPAAGSR